MMLTLTSTLTLCCLAVLTPSPTAGQGSWYSFYSASALGNKDKDKDTSQNASPSAATASNVPGISPYPDSNSYPVQNSYYGQNSYPTQNPYPAHNSYPTQNSYPNPQTSYPNVAPNHPNPDPNLYPNIPPDQYASSQPGRGGNDQFFQRVFGDNVKSSWSGSDSGSDKTGSFFNKPNDDFFGKGGIGNSFSTTFSRSGKDGSGTAGGNLNNQFSGFPSLNDLDNSFKRGSGGSGDTYSNSWSSDSGNTPVKRSYQMSVSENPKQSITQQGFFSQQTADSPRESSQKMDYQYAPQGQQRQSSYTMKESVGSQGTPMKTSTTNFNYAPGMQQQNYGNSQSFSSSSDSGPQKSTSSSSYSSSDYGHEPQHGQQQMLLTEASGMGRGDNGFFKRSPAQNVFDNYGPGPAPQNVLPQGYGNNVVGGFPNNDGFFPDRNKGYFPGNNNNNNNNNGFFPQKNDGFFPQKNDGFFQSSPFPERRRGGGGGGFNDGRPNNDQFFDYPQNNDGYFPDNRVGVSPGPGDGFVSKGRNEFAAQTPFNSQFDSPKKPPSFGPNYGNEGYGNQGYGNGGYGNQGLFPKDAFSGLSAVMNSLPFGQKSRQGPYNKDPFGSQDDFFSNQGGFPGQGFGVSVFGNGGFGGGYQEFDFAMGKKKEASPFDSFQSDFFSNSIFDYWKKY